MTSFLIALPSIYQPFTDDCVESMSPVLREHLHVIDNTAVNRGVAASWNDVARKVQDEGRDWLIVCSAATRFGAPGGEDFIAALEEHPDAWVVEPGMSAAGRLPVVGWHFIAWSRANVLDRVGLFDENFWPAYGEDMDMSRRILTAAALRSSGACDVPGGFWAKVTIDAEIVMAGHGTKVAKVQIDLAEIYAYYARKWGGPYGRELWRRPFGKYRLDYWPEPGAPPVPVAVALPPSTPDVDPMLLNVEVPA